MNANAYLDNEIIVHDGNAHLFKEDVKVDGKPKSRGLIPRDYSRHPVGSIPGIKAVDFPLIPQSEWAGRIDEQEKARSRNSDIRLIGNNGKPIPSTDQNGVGFCWNHSVTSAVMVVRALMGLPYVELSAFAIGCMIKNYRDEGGWGAQAAEFAIKNGIPSSKFWPIKSMNRSNDNPQTWADATNHKCGEVFMDVQAAVYDRNLAWAQYVTGFINNMVGVNDFSDWSHSVCGLDAVNGASKFGRCRAESGKLLTLEEHDLIWAMNDPVLAGVGNRHWNSWTDSYGNLGMGIRTGRQAIPDGGLLLRTSTPSLN